MPCGANAIHTSCSRGADLADLGTLPRRADASADADILHRFEVNASFNKEQWYLRLFVSVGF